MLCMFLYKVQTYSASNLMDLNNLAIVFSPTILKNTSADHSLEKEMEDIQKLKKVTEVYKISLPFSWTAPQHSPIVTFSVL